MADFNEGDFAELIKEVTKIELPDLEKTIFSIGCRGHYENPTSDILAFYLDPEAEHQLGSLVLDSLFSALIKTLETTPEGKFDNQPTQLSSLKEIIEKKSINLALTPSREVSTENIKKIDLLLEGDDWVMVIENKIYAAQNNPFKKYEQFVENYKTTKDKIFFVILSPEGNSINKKWIGLSYENFITKIEEKLGSEFILKPFNKWTVFLRDFILNLKQHTEREKMQTETLEFIGENIEEVLKFEKILKDHDKERNEKVKRLESKIGKNNNSENDCNIEHWIWQKYTFVTDIHYSNLQKTISLDIELSRKGWNFTIFLRDKKSTFPSSIENKFKTGDLKTGPHPELKGRLKFEKEFMFDVELEEVINFQQEIIKIVLDVLKEEKASEKTT